MNVKIVLENYQQQEYLKTYFVDIQCLQYESLVVMKVSMMYKEVKIAGKNFANP